MIYLQAPDHISSNFKSPSVFLAGGISNCPNWQSEVIKLVEHLEDNELTIVNPRQQDYLFSDVEVARKQIEWEYEYLHKVNCVAFWFPKETICPITLFELGYLLGWRSRSAAPRVLIGCHPEYSRKFDIEVQVGLREDIQIVNSIEELSREIIKFSEQRMRFLQACEAMKR